MTRGGDEEDVALWRRSESPAETVHLIFVVHAHLCGAIGTTTKLDSTIETVLHDVMVDVVCSVCCDCG
jgi:hypothetical protein